MIKKKGGKMCDCKTTDNDENILYIERYGENGSAIEMVCRECEEHIGIVNVNNYQERNYDEYSTN